MASSAPLLASVDLQKPTVHQQCVNSLRSLAVLGGLGEGLGGAGGGKCGRGEIRPAQKLCVFELCVRQRTQNSDWLKY